MLAVSPGWSGTLGLWKEAPLYVSDGLLKTLKPAGWKTVIEVNEALAEVRT
jgi:hypothetical protein